MSQVDKLKEEIGFYRLMYNICVELLDFGKETDMKKQRLYRLGREVFNNNNYNRIQTIQKELEKSTDDFISKDKIEKAVKDATDIDAYDQIVYKYTKGLLEIGPKAYMIECLAKVKKLENKIRFLKDMEPPKEELDEGYEKQKGEYIGYTSLDGTINKVNSTTSGKMAQSVGKLTIAANNIDSKDIHVTGFRVRQARSLKKIINNHLRNNNAYLEKAEIQQIKSEFKIDLFKDRAGYLSNDTIEKLFTIRIVNEQIDRNEDVSVKSIVDAVDYLYELALTEMTYTRSVREFGTKGAMNYEDALDSIRLIVDRDYVYEYGLLYEKLQNISYKFSKEEKELLSRYIQSSETMKGSKQLPTKEEFRKKLNVDAKKAIDWSKKKDKESYEIVEEIDNYLKYMTPEELASYYKTLKENNDTEKLQRVFVSLIGRRMGPIDVDLTEEEQKDELDRRYKAICAEYLKEEPVPISAKETGVRANYAQSKVELNEAEKRYFRDSKARQATGLMSFKKLKEKAKLKELNKKGILTKEELNKVKELFR